MEESFNMGNDLLYHMNSREFSKRHYNIMGFIIRMTLGCRKRECHIPKLVDFEQCGVSKTKIKNELNYLVKKKVIIWDEKSMLFSMNTNTYQWEIPHHKSLSKRYQQIIDLNS